MTPAEETAGQWLIEALATRDLERIQADMAAAGIRVNDARRHINSARSLASEDPTLALAACHDAIRKALTGHMRAAGYRPRPGEGAHRIVLAYARHQLAALISEDDLDAADAIRRDRAIAEYGDFAPGQFDADHIGWASDVAERVASAVARDLAAQSKGKSSRENP